MADNWFKRCLIFQLTRKSLLCWETSKALESKLAENFWLAHLYNLCTSAIRPMQWNCWPSSIISLTNHKTALKLVSYFVKIVAKYLKFSHRVLYKSVIMLLHKLKFHTIRFFAQLVIYTAAVPGLLLHYLYDMTWKLNSTSNFTWRGQPTQLGKHPGRFIKGLKLLLHMCIHTWHH